MVLMIVGLKENKDLDENSKVKVTDLWSPQSLFYLFKQNKDNLLNTKS